MLPYLHILIRAEDDGSVHAIGAFTTREKLEAYQNEAGLDPRKLRYDFYNGPFDESIEVIYAGHRRWNMDRFQLGGYFKTEGEAWNWVTQEGYVSVHRIDVTFEEEKRLEQEALERYEQLQKRWRLASYQSLVEAEGIEKARANITLRFYEDALESFKPKTRRDTRALYALIVLVLFSPIAIFIYIKSGPSYGENLASVDWLPDYASNVSYYRSKQIEVYEFDIKAEDFRIWAGQNGMDIQRVTSPKVLSRYKAYQPKSVTESAEAVAPGGEVTVEQFQNWQNQISVTVTDGMIAKGNEGSIAVYDHNTKKAYHEQLSKL